MNFIHKWDKTVLTETSGLTGLYYKSFTIVS